MINVKDNPSLSKAYYRWLRRKKTVDFDVLRSGFLNANKTYLHQIKSCINDDKFHSIMSVGMEVAAFFNANRAYSGYETLVEKNILPKKVFKIKPLTETSEDFANHLINKYHLSETTLRELSEIAFKYLRSILSKTKNGILPLEKARSVQFINNCIDRYFPILIRYLKKKYKLKKLIYLRKINSHTCNTACPRCGKLLIRTKIYERCTRTENRHCQMGSNALRRGRKKDDKSFVGSCSCCGVFSPLLKSHVLSGEQLLFCSQRCYERVRKKLH